MDEEAGSDVQRVTLTAGSILSRPRPSPPSSGGHSGGQGWRISPIPWRMMLTSSEASDPVAGPSSSPDYSHHPAHRPQSSPDLVTSNKRPLEDSDQGPSNLKIRRSSPEQAARDYDDIDRKISMAGNNHNRNNNNSSSQIDPLLQIFTEQQVRISKVSKYVRDSSDMIKEGLQAKFKPSHFAKRFLTARKL